MRAAAAAAAAGVVLEDGMPVATKDNVTTRRVGNGMAALEDPTTEKQLWRVGERAPIPPPRCGRAWCAAEGTQGSQKAAEANALEGETVDECLTTCSQLLF